MYNTKLVAECYLYINLICLGSFGLELLIYTCYLLSPCSFFFIFSLLILAQVPASWGSYEKTNFDPNN
jgi:hypothetical protein